MTGDDSKDPDLDNTSRDYLAATLRSSVAWVPIAGSALSEIVNVLVPNQRADRIAKFLMLLNIRIERMDAALQQLIKCDAERIALIEDGAYSAARSTTEERLRRIVDCVANGLSADESAQLLGRKLLQLFGDVDDHEVAVLHQHLQKALRRGAEVYHPRLGPQPVMPAEIRAKEQAAVERLELLGLLRFVPDVTEIPIMDPHSRRSGNISGMIPVPRLEKSGSRVGKY